MAGDEGWLNSAARAIADGNAVDWTGLESNAEGEDPGVIEGAHLVASIAAVYRSLPQTPAPSEFAHPAADGPADASGPVPATWGPLELTCRIGGGAYGDVYLAWDPRLAREVALKVLRANTGPRSDSGDPTIEEGRLLARVRHPNIVTVYGADEFDHRVGLWMEFIHGRSLELEIAERGPMGPDEAARIGIDLCRALGAVHGAGLVHRDVKAQNVMREPGGRIVLMDFGAGCETDNEAAGSGLIGTPLYLAPELFAGGAATASSDIYSAGVVLYHLVTGEYPVNGHSLAGLRRAHGRGESVPLRSRQPDLPDAFVRVVERALDRDPAERYESTAAMESALAEALEPVTGIEDEPSSARGGTTRPGTRRWLPATTRGRLASLAGIGSAVILVGLGLRATILAPSAGARLGFEARDWVLVTDFDNRTGDARLDGTVEYALARDLGDSRFVNVVPRQRVNDALRLMRKPVETVIDETVGREICLRDGGIPALVTGRVEKLGSRYAVSAKVLAASTGEPVLGASFEAPDEARLLQAVRSISNSIRIGLGEQRVRMRGNAQPLEKVTTQSLRALQLYSQGMALLARGADQSRWDAAGLLFGQAVKEDPEFASAWIYLSYSYRGTDAEAERLKYSERAMQLADRATEPERLFIEGAYHGQRRESAEAIAAYEALVKFYPDHYWGVNNLAVEYGRLNDSARALPYIVRQADLRPRSFDNNFRAASRLAAAGRAIDAARYAERARDVFPTDTAAEHLFERVVLDFLPVYGQWLRGDLDAAASTLGQLSAAKASQGSMDSRFLETLGDWQMGLGRLREAEATYQRLEKPEESLARLALARGDRDAARVQLRKWLTRPPEWELGSTGIIALAQAGLPKEAALALRSLPPPESPAEGQMRRAEAPIVLAAIAAAEGRPAEAVDLLSKVSWRPFMRTWWVARQVLARALEQLGDPRGALSALTEPSERPAGVFTATPGGAHVELWLEIQAERARLMRVLGRVDDARPIEAQIRKYLSRADSDHPLLRQADSR